MSARAALLVALLWSLGSGTADAKAPSRLFPYYEEDTGVLELGQVMAVGTRADILKADVHYQFMLATGIPDSQLGDGRLIVVSLYCCGGSIAEETSLWVFVPPDITVEPRDFVELRVGRAPGKNDPGVVNTVTAVRQKNGDAGSGPCRWEPDNPALWMRVVYCEGMDRHGWLQRGVMRKLWYKPAAAGGTEPAPAMTEPAPADAAQGAAAVAASEAKPVETANLQPAPAETSRESTPAPSAAADSATRAAASADCFSVSARPNLHEPVGVAFAKTPPPIVIRFEGEAGAELCERKLDLAFTSVVDRSSQRRNQDGASIMGLTGVLFAAITPWSCPTTHNLTAVVSNHSGEQVGRFEAHKLQRRVGTMLACGDVDEPNDSIVTELVSDVLRQMASAKLAAEPAANPAVEPAVEPAAEPVPPPN